MQIISKRSVEPARIEFSIVFDETDVGLAFFEQADPDEQLFFQVFSPQWGALVASQQLLALSRVASLAEAAHQASSLHLAASPPEPK